MPAMDKTGPLGTGPMGRGRGGCQTAENSSQSPRGQGRGGRCQGNGRGLGRGRCCHQGNGRGQETLSRDEEISLLEKQISTAQSRLNTLK